MRDYAELRMQKIKHRHGISAMLLTWVTENFVLLLSISKTLPTSKILSNFSAWSLHNMRLLALKKLKKIRLQAQLCDESSIFLTYHRTSCWVAIKMVYWTTAVRDRWRSAIFNFMSSTCKFENDWSWRSNSSRSSSKLNLSSLTVIIILPVTEKVVAGDVLGMGSIVVSDGCCVEDILGSWVWHSNTGQLGQGGSFKSIQSCTPPQKKNVEQRKIRLLYVLVHT